MSINKKRDNYICSLTSRRNEYGTPIYDEPFVYNENLTPTSGSEDIMEYGDRIFKVYKSTPPLYWKGKIKEGDVAYLEGASPFDDENYGASANYKVTSVRETINTLLIIFERI